MKGELISKEFEWYVEYCYLGDTYHIPLHPDQPKLFESGVELKVGRSVLFDVLYDNPAPYGLAVITEFAPSPSAPLSSEESDPMDGTEEYPSLSLPGSYTADVPKYVPGGVSDMSWDDIYEAALADNRTTMFGFLRYLKEYYNPPTSLL